MSDDVQRESMEYDVIIVGAGPAGLSASIRLKQMAAEAGAEISVAVLEKGGEVGAHILSGIVMDPKALNELIPDWREQGCPLETEVKDDIFLALSEHSSFRFPNFAFPPFMTNHGCYTGSLGAVCKWLGEQQGTAEIRHWP